VRGVGRKICWSRIDGGLLRLDCRGEMSRIGMIPLTASWSYTLCCFGTGEVLQDLCATVISFSSLSRKLEVSVSSCTEIHVQIVGFQYSQTSFAAWNNTQA
jgi:hypothetical protein